MFLKYFLVTVCREITKIVSYAQRKPSDRCTEKNTASKCNFVNEKLIFGASDRIGWVGPRAARFICKLLFSAKKLGSRATSSPRIFNLNQPFAKLNSKGSILIEFAVCMPILIILLFYIHDLIKIKRYYSQTEFVAQQMANIIQNISQKRSDKKITLTDLGYAASLAFLSIYPGKTMYSDRKRGNASHELSHFPKFHIHYVKGLSGGKASGIWALRFRIQEGTTPTEWAYTVMKSTDSDSKVKWGTNLAQSTIYPTLKMDEGKYKIILECVLYNGESSMSNNEYLATDSQSTRAKKSFKCRLITPKPNYKSDGHGYYFDSVVIFTPKPGLFDETAPSEQ